LLAAVGYLYFYDFSGKKNKVTVAGSNYTMEKDSNCNRPPLAYVELDSLNENIAYIKDKRRELEAEQKAIESEWENGYKGLETQKNNFLKKGASITQEEAQQFQGTLMQQQQVIDNKKQSQTQKLNEKSFIFMDDIQKQLKSFLADYNKDKKYMYIFTTGTGLDYMVYKDSSMNITNEVIRGMNQKMKSAGHP
jgi:outer membrane protein